MSKECEEILNKCSLKKDVKYKDGILPTKLYCRLYDVDEENKKQLSILSDDVHVFEAEDEIHENNTIYEKLLENCKGKKIFFKFFQSIGISRTQITNTKIFWDH